MDKEGRTPLILACTKAEHYNVTETLLELGSNVNAYRSGISSLRIFLDLVGVRIF